MAIEVIHLVHGSMGDSRTERWVVEAWRDPRVARIRCTELNTAALDLAVENEKLYAQLIKDDDFEKFAIKKDALFERYQKDHDEPSLVVGVTYTVVECVQIKTAKRFYRRAAAQLRFKETGS